MEHFHALHGSGIAEDKRVINSKTAYTLKALPMKVLEFYFASPDVPKSMKDKLYEAIELKNQPLKGGLKGVSKASGFIRRLMWENSHKHDGNYRNPTWELAGDSTMNRPEKFLYKKLASASQGGLNREGNPYGASPFIKKHFSKVKPEPTKDKESDIQKEARANFKVKAPTITQEEASEVLQQHFGNVGEEAGRPGSPEPQSPQPEEETVPAPAPAPAPKVKRVIKIKKAPQAEPEPKNEIVSHSPILSEDVLNNKVWKMYAVFWMNFLNKHKNVKWGTGDDSNWAYPFGSLTYTHAGFWNTLDYGAPYEVSNYNKKMDIYKDFLKEWMGYEEKDLVISSLASDKSIKFYQVKTDEEDWKKRHEQIKKAKDTMGYAWMMWLIGRLVEKGWSVEMIESPYESYNDKLEDWETHTGKQMVVINPEGDKGWGFGRTWLRPFDGKPFTASEKLKKVDGKWEVNPNGDNLYKTVSGHWDNGKRVDGILEKIFKDAMDEVKDAMGTNPEGEEFRFLLPDDAKDSKAKDIIEEYKKDWEAEDESKMAKTKPKKKRGSGRVAVSATIPLMCGI